MVHFSVCMRAVDRFGDFGQANLQAGFSWSSGGSRWANALSLFRFAAEIDKVMIHITDHELTEKWLHCHQ